jgi:uncharacterized protein with FMN-binding domain
MLLSFKTHSTVAVATPPAAVSSVGTASSSSGSSSRHAAKTYTGSAADTQYGPVEVKITVKNGRVIVATAVQYPNSSPRDSQINAAAIPALNSEATAASSASIDMVSGATYTSQGYISSLQSALDQAGL